METPRRLVRISFLLPALAFLGACPFDSSLRQYLSAYFWQPFAKREPSFEKPHVHRIYKPFAGMTPVDGHSSLANLRAAYQNVQAIDIDKAIADARADRSLSRKDNEEVDLIDAHAGISQRSPRLACSHLLPRRESDRSRKNISGRVEPQWVQPQPRNSAQFAAHELRL
jgi:hypothetical protein